MSRKITRFYFSSLPPFPYFITILLSPILTLSFNPFCSHVLFFFFLPPLPFCCSISIIQVEGIRFLYNNLVESQKHFKSTPGFGCILAHSMGLGKTLQVISFIDIVLRHTGAHTVLAIVPVSVCLCVCLCECVWVCACA